jgi:hypothetical protein
MLATDESELHVAVRPIFFLIHDFHEVFIVNPFIIFARWGLRLQCRRLGSLQL